MGEGASERGNMRNCGLWRMRSLSVLVLFFLLGCVHPLSSRDLKTVEKELTFSRVIENPRAYFGGIVLWGGVIRSLTQGPAGTDMIITQCPLDNKGSPQTEVTQGEFMAYTVRRLDPEIFHQETKVSLVAEFYGLEEEKWGPEEYPRPRVRIIQIYAWIPRIWGIFPVTRKGWEVEEVGPLPSPFQVPEGERVSP